MIRTHGLTHITLAVVDPERSLRFYEAVFGVQEYFRDETMIQAKGYESMDIFAFERKPSLAGKTAGIEHFGFRLVDADDIEHAIHVVREAGGTILRRGEFAPGYPYVYVTDPDGYEIEIWFE